MFKLDIVLKGESVFIFPKENEQHSLLNSLAISLSSGVSNSLMALVPLQHSPVDQGTPLYPAAWQSILVRLVGKVMAQGLITAGVWGVLTQSLTLVGVWDLPL